ncbi:uncharacterized protein LOC143030070 [Oratosquilla oratoria]|uniref:uncharacterized protein LOC143030070 n=1 Tax=Oratosquilla oratoria TaxID=337810 RepID=UPI003F768FEB
MDQAAFERKLRQTLEGKAENAVIQPTIQRHKYIRDLLRINSYGAHSAFDYNLKKRYEVLRVGNADRLIRKRKDKNEHEFNKFCALRRLTSKRAEEVAANLLDILLTFGAPAILQSDNGREFVNAIIAELSVLWPELKLVTGRHPQSQGAVERLNGTRSAGWIRVIYPAKYSLCNVFTEEDLESFLESETGAAAEVETGAEAEAETGAAAEAVTRAAAATETGAVEGETEVEAETGAVAGAETEIEAETATATEAEVEAETGAVAGAETEIEAETGVVTEADAETETVATNFQKIPVSATLGQSKTATRMTRRGKYLLKPLSVGQCATLRVPDVDRGPTDPKNLLVVVLKENDGLHTVGCREGIIGPKFTAPDLCAIKQPL